MINSKWSNEDIIYFLQVYEKYPVLWDAQSKSYRDKDIRKVAFEQLVDELNVKFENITLDVVRTKIKMVKTVLSQELGKIFKSKQSGVSEDNVYKPKLMWFENAAFLKNSTTSRQSHLQMDDFSESGEEFKHQTTEETAHSEHYIQNSELTISPPKPKPVKRKLTNSSEITKRKFKKSEIVQTDQIAQATTTTSTLQFIEHEDELTCFGKYVAAQLRTMPPFNALRCQLEIQNVISKEKLALLQCDNFD